MIMGRIKSDLIKYTQRRSDWTLSYYCNLSKVAVFILSISGIHRVETKTVMQTTATSDRDSIFLYRDTHVEVLMLKDHWGNEWTGNTWG